MKQALLSICAAAIGLAVAGTASAATTLETVKARGKLICGVSLATPGFAAPDDKGRMQGFDADICRSIAAAVFGDGDKVDASLKAEIEAAVAATKTAVESGEPEAMTEKAQALAQVAMKLGQAIYEKEQQSAAAPGADAGEAKTDDVVDAEFSEVDDTNTA